MRPNEHVWNTPPWDTSVQWYGPNFSHRGRSRCRVVPLFLGAGFVWVENISSLWKLLLPWVTLCGVVVFFSEGGRIRMFASLFSQSHLHYYLIDVCPRETEPKPPRELWLKAEVGPFQPAVKLRKDVFYFWTGQRCLCSGETLVEEKCWCRGVWVIERGSRWWWWWWGDQTAGSPGWISRSRCESGQLSFARFPRFLMTKTDKAVRASWSQMRPGLMIFNIIYTISCICRAS